MKKIWLPAFIALSALHIIAVAAGIDMLRTCTKPLLMPVLALWLVSETPGIRSSLRTGWLIGLFFSTLGDILLMFPGGLYFLLGLSAFLLAHLSYIGGITTGLRGRRGFLLQNPLWMAPFCCTLSYCCIGSGMVFRPACAFRWRFMRWSFPPWRKV